MDKQRVLIIDDDKDIVALFSVVLSMVGFECEVVNTAREGLARLSMYKFASLHEDLKKSEDIQVIVERMSASLLRVYQVREKSYRPILSIGAALCEDQFIKPDDVLDAAEGRMKPLLYLDGSQESPG